MVAGTTVVVRIVIGAHHTRHVIRAGWKVFWNGSHLVVVAHLEHERHAHLDVVLNVAMEQPVARIVGDKPNDCVATVGHGDRVLGGSTAQPAFDEARIIQRLNLNTVIYETI